MGQFFTFSTQFSAPTLTQATVGGGWHLPNSLSRLIGISEVHTIRPPEGSRGRTCHDWEYTDALRA